MRTSATSTSDRTTGAASSSRAPATPVSTSSRPICSGSGRHTLSEDSRPMIRLTPRFTAAALGLLLAATACQNDTVNRPFSNIPVDPLFERYVSMGNSITAGFQSGGINDSTQAQSYAVLLAQAMHSPFFVPLLDRKSTRLNSSHSQISYAVFCLKKKK